jgi:glucosamine-6-phosphate deaminase
MSFSELPTIARFREDQLEVLVYESRALAGRAAAQGIVQAVRSRQRAQGIANIVFAAAPSQDEFLAGLVAANEIDWPRVNAFHMDEYLGIDADHRVSFRRYLQERLFLLVGLGPDRMRLIPGEQVDRPLQTCLDYEDVLRAHPTDIVCAGIGENGHLAFNDPPGADFLDPVLVKVVRLDAACRNQQLNDGCFERLDDVPTHAYTLTIPALLRAPVVSVVVPGARKANAVLTALRGPICEACPATALRRHPGARLYLDREAARLVL